MTNFFPFLDPPPQGPPVYSIQIHVLEIDSDCLFGMPLPPHQSRRQLWIVPIFFRDNGITIQIMAYQLYVEVVVVFLSLVFGMIPIERNLLMLKINATIGPFATFVIQPLFYLNGDVNFRRRVLHQGLWKALKKELFYDS